MEPITMGLAAGQAIWGAIDAISGSKKLDRAMDQREANLYKTPDEINDIAGMNAYLAQGGYDAVTLNYLTNNIYRSSSSALNTVEKMGGDVNDVSGILDKQIEGFMRVGAENAQMQFKNFSNYIDSVRDVAKHKDAEWQDATNFLKDKMQSAAQQKQSGMQMLWAGINAASSGIAMGKQSNMFEDLLEKIGQQPGKNATASAGGGAGVSAMSTLPSLMTLLKLVG